MLMSDYELVRIEFYSPNGLQQEMLLNRGVLTFGLCITTIVENIKFSTNVIKVYKVIDNKCVSHFDFEVCYFDMNQLRLLQQFLEGVDLHV